MRYEVPVPLTTHTAFTSWEFAPVVTAGLSVFALLYLWGMSRVHRRPADRAGAVLYDNVALAGVTAAAPADDRHGGTVDDDAHLDADNAYLARLGGRDAVRTAEEPRD